MLTLKVTLIMSIKCEILKECSNGFLANFYVKSKNGREIRGCNSFSTLTALKSSFGITEFVKTDRQGEYKTLKGNTIYYTILEADIDEIFFK